MSIHSFLPGCRSSALTIVLLASVGCTSGASAQAPSFTAADLLGGREAVPREPRPAQGCFSPDGQWIYYGTDEPDPALWRIPTAGGAPERLVSAPRCPTWLDLSPDGRVLAFDHAGAGDDFDVSLFVLEEKRFVPLATTSRRERFPAWRPGGAGLLYVRRNGLGKRGEASPAEIVVCGGDAKPRFEVPLQDVRCNAAWSGDGKSILLFQYVPSRDHCQLVRLTFPGLGDGADPASSGAPTRVDAVNAKVLAVLVGEDVFDLRIAPGGRHATFARGSAIPRAARPSAVCSIWKRNAFVRGCAAWSASA